MQIIWILLAILAILAAICIVRAALAKPSQEMPFVVTPERAARSAKYAAGLVQLIRAETISSRHDLDRTKFYMFHAILAKEFPNLHRVCDVHDFDGSLLFHWRGANADASPVLFLLHMDVVEAHPSEWKHDPFAGEIENGKIYGRGAIDNKSPMYIVMKALDELVAENTIPPCDLYIASSCTEEIQGSGAKDMSRFLMEHGLRFRFIMDEGGMVVERPIKGIPGTYAVVGVSEKTQANVRLVARGTGGHASAPPRNTPLVRLGRLMADLDKKSPFHPKLEPFLLDVLRTVGLSLPFPARIVTENMWLFKPLIYIIAARIPMINAMTRTTVAFTKVQSVDGYNVLPKEASVNANVRYAPHQGFAESNEILRKFAARYDVEIELLDEGDYIPVTDYKSEAFKLVEGVINEIYPEIGVLPYMVTSGTDSKFYTSLSDNILRFVPLHISAAQVDSIHGSEENVDVNTLASGVDFVKLLVRKL